MKMDATGVISGVGILLSLVSVGQVAYSQVDQDLVILSHRFDQDRFSNEIIGEIMNNDTRSYDKFDVDIFANFRDASGALLTSEQGFMDAETLRPGQSSAFSIFLLDEELPEAVTTYDLIVNDERVVIGQPLEGNGDDNDSDSEGGNNDNNDGGNGDGGSDSADSGNDGDEGNSDNNDSADSGNDGDDND